MRLSVWRLAPAVARCLLASGVLALAAGRASAEPLVPGTGELLVKVGDDFEDPDWSWTPNLPKSSKNIDERVRAPGGASVNGRWMESALRGQPDLVKRVPTPPGGLEGSEGSLLIRSLYTGIPNAPSGQNQQDDLLVNVRGRLGGTISAAYAPSAVVRVYLPPWEEWEQRTGNSFAFRAGCLGSGGNVPLDKRKNPGGLEEYWPGMFIHLNCPADSKVKEYSARFIIRANPSGRDLPGPEIKETGWWTLGMSFTPDGMVHYYIRQGAGDLTSGDHVASHYPYGFRNQKFETVFFNVVNRDNGRNWSTPWIIDDVTIHAARPGLNPAPQDRTVRQPASKR